jgi:hypothetical protein
MRESGIQTGIGRLKMLGPIGSGFALGEIKGRDQQRQAPKG